MLEIIMSWLHQLHDPEGLKLLIASYGLWLLVGIVFSETGLLVGFFLPGDSLLFIAGAMCAVNFVDATVAQIIQRDHEGHMPQMQRNRLVCNSPCATHVFAHGPVWLTRNLVVGKVVPSGLFGSSYRF